MKIRELDQTIEAAIRSGKIPGAVLWLESKGHHYEAAYGERVKSPVSETMTSDTIFDLASLTKVLVTTPSVLRLMEEGKIDLEAPVSQYLPEFIEGGLDARATDPTLCPEDRRSVTVLHLLTHRSGLPPSIAMEKTEFWGPKEGVGRALGIGLLEKPGSRFRYSDVNFILLAEMVSRISGTRIDEFARENFFKPLGMDSTCFLPGEALVPKIAPTTVLPGYGVIRGEVHDPTARRMRGVAGHAGLFSNAEDVARYCRMWLNGGELDGKRFFRSETIEMATCSQCGSDQARGLGWDIGSKFSYHRGEKFPSDGYGHTGWTGTSIWVDRASQSFVILLTNRNHPRDAGSINALRTRIGTLAAEAVGYLQPASRAHQVPDAFENENEQVAAGGPPGKVANGIDLLESRHFDLLKGLRIGLITNHTGINRQRRSTIDLLANAPDVNLVKLFAPEHGIRGTLETDSIADGKDRTSGLPVFSLFKEKSRKPTAAQLEDIDALVFDIQDIGCRFYTYISTMGLAMEAASEHGKKFIVLDRVNPIGGIEVDGPVRSGTGNDFVAFHDIPVRHGMTAGELARMFQAERGLKKLELQIVPVEGWSRSMRFDETGLPWLNPSPNIRSLTEAMLYPGVGLLEFTNLSVGRGTPTPFEQVGAPWISEGRLADRLDREKLPGLQFVPVRFTPGSSVHQGEDCGGVRIIVTDRDLMNPIDLGFALGRAIHADYPKTFDLGEKGNILLRHPLILAHWMKGSSNRNLRKLFEEDLRRFMERRQKYLIYPNP